MVTKTKEELIEEAKQRFPLGTKLKNHLCSSIFTFQNRFENGYNPDGLVCNSDNGNYTIYDADKNIWAEVMSYPKDYIVPSENALSKLELW